MSHADRPSLSHTAQRRLQWAGQELAEWFERSGRDFPWRRPDASLYEVQVSEVLLQRTRAQVVARFLPQFVAEFPDWESLSPASTAKLASTLQPIGLQNRRAKSLASLARERLALGAFPDDRKRLEVIPAVGQYVASAILLFEHGRPEPLLDTNMARILERFEQPRKYADLRRDPFLQQGSRALIAPDPVIVNWATLDLGATVCLPRNPGCQACPLVSKCRRIGVDDDGHEQPPSKKG